MDAFSYEDWLGDHIRELDRIAIEKVPYDVAFTISAYQHFNPTLRAEAEELWEEVKGLFPPHTNIRDISWKAVFTVMTERIVKGANRKTFMDMSGALCWSDAGGVFRCGNGKHLYPRQNHETLMKMLGAPHGAKEV